MNEKKTFYFLSTTTLNYILLFVFSFPTPLDHDFMSFFLTVNTLFFCVMFSIMGIFSNAFPELKRLQGEPSYLNPQPNFDPR